MTTYYKCFLCGKFFIAIDDKPSFILKWYDGKDEPICVDCFKNVLEREHEKHIKKP